MVQLTEDIYSEVFYLTFMMYISNPVGVHPVRRLHIAALCMKQTLRFHC